jgi:hypothetical protein
MITWRSTTHEEQACVEALQQLEAFPEGSKEGMWVMRRIEHTEHENPNHMGFDDGDMLLYLSPNLVPLA